MYDLNDPSIQTVLEIMKKNPRNRKYLKHAGEVFNSLSGSDRNIIPDFYDCGTTARAIFMSLINNYRGNITFSKAEKAHLKKYTEVKGRIDGAIRTLEEMDNGVMICSLVIHNLDPPNSKNYQAELGHVWIIEKKNGNYRLYQSALNNYTTVDHMAKYGIDIDGPQLLHNIKPLLGKGKWSTSENSHSALFCSLFHYLPTIPLHQIDSVFHWTSIEYYPTLRVNSIKRKLSLKDQYTKITMSNQKTARSNRYTDYKDFCEQVQTVLNDKEDQHCVNITINWKNDDNSYTGLSSTYLFYDNPIPNAKRKIDYLQSELEKERLKLAKFEEESVKLAKFEEECDQVKTQPKNKKVK